jgi:hypothetical protein
LTALVFGVAFEVLSVVAFEAVAFEARWAADLGVARPVDAVFAGFWSAFWVACLVTCLGADSVTRFSAAGCSTDASGSGVVSATA